MAHIFETADRYIRLDQIAQCSKTVHDKKPSVAYMLSGNSEVFYLSYANVEACDETYRQLRELIKKFA